MDGYVKSASECSCNFLLINTGANEAGPNTLHLIRRLQCAVKGAGPQRDERPARELDRSTR